MNSALSFLHRATFVLCLSILSGSHIAAAGEWHRTDTTLAWHEGDQILWSFSFDPQSGKPFFNPLSTKGNPSLTNFRPEDHPWHYGLWFSWKYINGANYWEEDRATGRAEGATRWSPPVLETRTDGSATIQLDLTYTHPSGRVDMIESRDIRVSAPAADGSYAIDWSAHFTAGPEGALLDRTPMPGEPNGQVNGGYAGLGIRMASSPLVMTVVTPDGPVDQFVSDRARPATSAVGCNFTDGSRELGGIAILSDASNSGVNAPWYLINGAVMRFACAAVLAPKPIKLDAGQRWNLRYRIAVNPTVWTQDALAQAQSAWQRGSNKTRLAADQLPEVTGLANPFVFIDGSAVRTTADWERRRAELKTLFEDYQYGSLPPKPEKLRIFRSDVAFNDTLAVSTQDFILRMEDAGRKFDLHMRLAIPLSAQGRVPVVIQSADGGGPPPPPRPGRSNIPEPTEPSLFTTRGYATASFRYSEAAADNKETARESGVYTLFGRDIDTGGLMAWAWGVHRVIDALETIDRIDTAKIVVTGHSRNGKAALVAGAFDERIALTVPSHSGCAGAASFRFIYGNSEQLHNIAGYAPQWFRPDFSQFVGKVNRLPLDQHLLKALVAPRALMSTEGTQDAWTNPEGSQLTYLAAREVYNFLGAGDRISIRYRPVGHIPSDEDLVDYADHVFFGKPLPSGFGPLAYAVEGRAYDWKAPAPAN